MTAIAEPADQAVELYKTAYYRVANFCSAERMWYRLLSPAERETLGGELPAAFQQYGVAGMWAHLRGVTRERAILELAKKLNHISNTDYRWLLREFGMPESVGTMESAIASGHLVIDEDTREVHFNGTQIEIDWHKYNALWVFFLELAMNAKAGRPVDRMTFGENAHEDIVAKRKSKLVNMENFPIQLADLISPAGRGAQQLEMPRKQIRIFRDSGAERRQELDP